MPRLLKSLIDRLQPQAREYLVRDSELRGFACRVQPSGHMSYILRYRFPSGRAGRQRTYTLGTTQQLTIDDARGLAREWLALVRQGVDPMAERQRQRTLPTVDALAARYLTEHADVKKKPRSAKMDHVNMRLHVLPALGTRQVAELTRTDITHLHHAMRATPGAANRVLALLSKMLSLAEEWGLRAPGSNPVRGVTRYRERHVQRFLSAQEVAQLGAVMEQAEETRTEMPQILALFRLLIYTGARLSEIRTLQWIWIDWERQRLQLPDSKTGQKWIYLAPAAVALLDQCERVAGNPYVLPGRVAGQPLISVHKAWKRLCMKAGIQGVRLHDLRHTYASWAAQQGLSLPMIGALLGHQDTQTTAGYAHLVAEPVAQAAAQVGAAFTRALAGA